MKTCYFFLKNLPIYLYAGICILSAVNISVSSQTINSNIIHKDSVLLANDSIVENLKKDRNVFVRTEISAGGDTIFHFQNVPFGLFPDKNDVELFNKNQKNTTSNQLPISEFNKPQINSAIIQSVDQTKSVGQIPFEEGKTPSGGKTYSIPILTAMVASSSPQISLNYNSQAGNGVAGFGWNIGGISAITLNHRNQYYDGATSAWDISLSYTASFYLDGVRLVGNNDLNMSDEYQLETAQGYILVKKIFMSEEIDRITHFEVLYPNGSIAIFGLDGNDSNRHIYPIRSITDIKGYRIDFKYIQSGNNYYISKIKYGGKTETTHTAEISFDYIPRTDYITTYISGIDLSPNLLLKTITTKNNDQELRIYTLTHSLSDNVHRLTKLDCSSGASSLNPLMFRYETYYPGDNGALTVDPYGAFLIQYFATNALYKRGKFIKNNFNDGLITYPKFSTYTIIARRGNHYQFGSIYSPEQNFLIAPRLDYVSRMDSLNVESGFQELNAVDVNGDGVDEIVKINFDKYPGSGSKTKLKITVYSYNSSYTLTSRSFSVYVEGIVNDDGLISPISRSYYFGDFIGNGMIQLLTVSHNKTFLNQSRTSYFALVNLQAGTLISEKTLFSHAPDEYVVANDINGDGKTEICRSTSQSYEVYAYNGNSFANLFSDNTISKNSRTLYADLNADGLTDMLIPPTDSYHDIRWVEIPIWAPHYCPFCGGSEPIIDIYNTYCRHCNVNLIEYYANNPDYSNCRECGTQLQWCNNDPYDPSPDGVLCCPYHGSINAVAEIDFGYVDNGNAWLLHLSTGKGFVHKTNAIVNTEYGEKYYLTDMNKDGCADLIQIRNNQMKLFLNKNAILQSTTNVNPVTVESGTDIIPANIINYNGMSYIIKVKGAVVSCYSFTKDESKNHLLTSMTDSYGLVRLNTYLNMTEGGCLFTSTVRSYPFASYIAPVNLLSSSIIYKDNTPISHLYYTYYGAVIHQQGLGFCGFEKIKTLDYMLNMETVESKNPEMFGVTTSVTSPFKDGYYYYERNEESNKQANPRMTSLSETDKLTNVYSYANYSYDAYNNPTQVNHYAGSTISTITTQTYYNSVSSTRYLLGQPLIKTVTTTRNGVSWQNKEEITYNTNRLPASRITYTGSTAVNKTGETRWTYDTNGNVTSEKSALYNVTEFLGNTYTYDPSGRYLASQTNALSQTTTFSNYDKYGNARAITDHKGRVTTQAFDDWGQPVSATSPDGVVESTTPAWGGQGVYTVTQTVTGKPSSIVHYDAAGREIRKGNQRFDGSWQFVDNVYDNKGRLEKVSLPFKGTSPTYWNTYTYDTYNRPTQLSEASGKTTTWSYNGLSVTETKNGIAVTKTSDESGALISVTDPGGILTYTLRPDGQPSSVTAPGGVVTTFGYDAFGRQTSIADPSAGTQTFGDVYTAAGVLTRTVTDANNKTVTTVYDKYGRVTGVTRPEFNTSYAYNTDGLPASETSTNGTSATFTYDTFDRPLTTKEIVPDSKYLQKEYAYASGNVATVKYTSQSGLIGTEYFTYAYGHNTEIKLNNTTSIWKLTAENALGQPTQATTGPMARTYGYTAYGMPTGRTAGTVQSFTYNFDVTKGNLTSRTDAKRNKTESFGYDNLNRLSSIGTQTITYADNGNITQMPGVGTMTYENAAKPYQVTLLTPTGSAVPMREQAVTYTSYQRPNTLTENGITATFTYNAAGDRVKMNVMQASTALLTRYYLGGQYELDAQSGVERLYLGGDVYSAPTVYVKESGVWNIYYICRDYLGSITHVANADGSLKQELSYDAWGRLRDPATQTAYTPGSEPALFLGRGYTAHEYLPWFGLVNMNARLYDPALGRFLSPDPYVQNPLFSQNYNRYTYAMNNPLVYIDQDGEFANWIIAAIVGVFFYAKTAHDNTPEQDQGDLRKWKWNPFSWGKPEEVVFHFGSNTDGSGMYGGVSAGKSGQPQPMVGYSSNQGPGLGHHYNGKSNMYYPGYDYNKPEKGVNEALYQAQQNYHRQQNIANGIDPGSAIAGAATTTFSELYYSKTYNTWMGKNYKVYRQTWGGNQYTGGKNKYGKRMSNYFRYLGYGIGAYSAANINQERMNGDIGWTKWSIEQTSNLFSTLGGTIGAAWGIGWEAGRAVTLSQWYQERKYNFFYDQWERRYGRPSSSNEWIWNYFYQNYKP